MSDLPHKPSDEVIKYKDLQEVLIECADCEKELFKMVKEGKAEIIEEDHPSGALEDRSNSE